MAKYNVTFSCGHTVEKQLFGKNADRQHYMAWAARLGACPACMDAVKATKIEAFEVGNDLPALEGTDKQIAWARGVRVEKLEAIDAWFAQTREKVPGDRMQLFEDQCAVTLQAMYSKVSAVWWIDRRDLSEMLIANEVFKGLAK